ncbi:calcium/sodium antiporter [Paucibacter sp. TC2R-5]|uniref:calcium/sodium antiporter n=1 Tax=Paucibacter sp. TC2R-5 TaxID=2893555 RepID=UPI0021E41645|nr:calcium/sodium antiporter [Paucibacter sp. TC2R-5]MCV2357929.1 calcium/sodium antiporter [Paucibacter sp. TC2R-5]
MLTLGFFLLGLIALVCGAELLVRGASKLALSAGISPLVVGLTVVSMGTSAPEVAVSIGAALDGLPDLAIGNVVGSNIFNVLFILGISALIVPLTVHAQVIRQEVPVMIGASLLLLALGLDGRLSINDGLLMMALFLAYTVLLVRQSRRESKETQAEFTEEMPAEANWDKHWAVQILLIAVGLGLLVLGSGWLVDAAITVAKSLGVSDLVIGLTIVAAGTSMPEVATSIMAAIRGQRDIAIGNVVGSNIFNILGCLGLTALIAPASVPVADSVLNFDIWVMLVVALACLPVMLSGREIARWEGFIFIGYYVAYTAYLILMSQQHDALPMFSNVMLMFFLPLTVLTLIASLLRKPASNKA